MAVLWPEECPPSYWGQDKTEVLQRRGKPDEVVLAGDNEEKWIYRIESNRWCGVFAFLVVLPLPLMLPLCNEFDRVTFKGDQLQSSYSQRLGRDLDLVAPPGQRSRTEREHCGVRSTQRF
jgi:hypothetical protein